MEAENPKKQKATMSAILSRRNGGAMAELEFNEDLIFEILTWLPIKKIIQWQCLSKQWHSIIQSKVFREHYTIRVPRSGNPPCVGIIVSNPDSDAEHSFMYAPLEDGKPLDVDCDDQRVKSFALRHTVPFPEFEDVTQVINGLVCLYTGNRVTLCNVCTRETIPLPPSPSRGNETSVSYHFGFDTINLVYKVLKLSIFPERETVADVLTLGDGDLVWRTLGVSVRILKKWSLCIAGKLYWISRIPIYASKLINLDCFDLCREQFDRITTPPSQMPYREICLRDTIPMIYNQRLALAYLDCRLRRLNLWIPANDSGSSWFNKSIDLPFNNKSWMPVGVLPTGEILVMNYKGDGLTSPVYSYDCETRKFKQRFLVDNFPTTHVVYRDGIDPDGMDPLFHISCMEENILPLDVVIRGKQRFL